MVVIDSSARSSGKQLRVGFDARYINDRYHGIGRYAFRLLEALVSASPEVTFVIFTGRVQDSRFSWDGLAAQPNVKIEPGPWPLYWPQEQLRWPWILRRSRVDLFHSPYFVGPLLAKLPVIITVHDLIFDRYPKYMPMAWSRPYYRLLMAAGIRRASRVIAVSQSTAGDLAIFYDTPHGKVDVIPEGVEPAFRVWYEPQQIESLRRRYHLERPYILTVGARRPHKNMVALVKAYAGLAQRSTCDLVFAGPADSRFPDEPGKLTTQLGLDERVHFLNWIPENLLPGLYSQAELVVLPSLMEGFGLPALEAMACGTPVLAADNSSFPEVTGDAGLLFDPYDIQAMRTEMERALKDQNLRQTLIKAGEKRAAAFTWQAAARRTRDIYHAVLNELYAQASNRVELTE